jgi:hypothetical protein
VKLSTLGFPWGHGGGGLTLIQLKVGPEHSEVVERRLWGADFSLNFAGNSDGVLDQRRAMDRTLASVPDLVLFSHVNADHVLEFRNDRTSGIQPVYQVGRKLAMFVENGSGTEGLFI